MDLSDLTAYAERKFHISEQYKWADFPGFSVLSDPRTGKWAALLMRQWDADSGTEIELCDIKCGQQSLSEIQAPYLAPPFRMRGKQWIGVRFDSRTEPEVVYGLLDRALSSEKQDGFTVVLDGGLAAGRSEYRETPLPFEKIRPDKTEMPIPKKIREMRRLYEYGDGSFRQKCRNFYVQGKFMENYEDDLPWQGEIFRYFPTYHDLSLAQLRGFFTWRTEVRKGNYQKIGISAAYLYLYELLNGIGAASVRDSLRKMQEFEVGYLDSGFGDRRMYNNLHRWMLELAVLNGIEPDAAEGFADKEMIQKDHALMTLRKPMEYSDHAVFEALCLFGGSRTASSVVIQKNGDEGIHLFSEVWRTALAQYREDGGNLFAACFGKRHTYRWHPLGNAVYYENKAPKPETYELNECRKFSFRDGVWYEQSYQKLYFDRKKLNGLLHEADRRLRLYLKTGHPMRERDEDAWAAPYIEAVIEEDKKIKIEAAKPKIIIRFSDLDNIRRDALKTRDSLLTEEDRQAETEREDTGAGNEIAKAAPAPKTEERIVPLDDMQIHLLRLLLQGKPVKALIAAQRGMPEVIADELNEAFFDEIGDNVVECDKDVLVLVEDYRDDISRILGGNTE